MPSYLQQIASRFENLEPDKARELLRIDAAYIRFGLSDGAPGDPRAVHYTDLYPAEGARSSEANCIPQARSRARCKPIQSA